MEAGASVSAHGKALTLARKHDPEQKRTFGVFTKVDARLTGDSPRDHVEYAMQNHPLKVMGQEGYHAVSVKHCIQSGQCCCNCMRHELIVRHANCIMRALGMPCCVQLHLHTIAHACRQTHDSTGAVSRVQTDT